MNDFEKSVSGRSLNHFRNRRILITGGMGFLGSNLAHVLVKGSGARIVILDSMAAGSGANRHNLAGIEQDVELHIGRMGDRELVDKLIPEIEFVFNLAGSISHLDSMQDPVSDYHDNCGDHVVLLEACRRRNPHVTLVLSSTRQVYGRPAFLPVTENHPLVPVDINGIHMLACELYHQIWREVCGMRVVILRLTNCYGPRQLIRHPRQGLTGWFLRQALTGGRIELFGGGRQRRDFNYVDDVLEALLLAAMTEKSDGRIYNLGSEEVVSLKEFAGVLAQIAPGFPVSEREFPADRKAIDIGSYCADFSSIRNDLGWSPKVLLREGLERSLDFCRRHLDWYLP